MARTKNTLFDSAMIGGGIDDPAVNVTAAYTVPSYADYVRCTATGAYTVTLPPVSSVPLGTVITLVKADASANLITVAASTVNGTDLINGAATNTTGLPSGSYGVLRLRAGAPLAWDIV